MYGTFFTVCMVILSCKSSTTNSQNQMEMENSNSDVYYTCTMHSEIQSDKPGNCPECDMELVQKAIDKSDTTLIHHHNKAMEMN